MHTGKERVETKDNSMIESEKLYWIIHTKIHLIIILVNAHARANSNNGIKGNNNNNNKEKQGTQYVVETSSASNKHTCTLVYTSIFY